MPVLALEKRNIDAIQPEEKEVAYHDDKVAGFVLRVSPLGNRVFYYYYTNTMGTRRKIKIGPMGRLTPQDARQQAKTYDAMVLKGIDPYVEKEKEIQAAKDAELAKKRAITLDQFFQTYLDEYAKVWKKKGSVVQDEYNYKRYVKDVLGGLPLDSIASADILRFQNSLKAHRVTANRCLALLSKVLAFAEDWGARPVGSNPCRLVKKFKEGKRERYLDGPEMARLFKAIDELEANWHEEDTAADDESEHEYISPDAAAAFRLLAFTGCRRGEILSLMWDHVDLEDKALYLPDSKTGRKTVYLNSAALEVLNGLKREDGYVIQGRLKGKPMVNLALPWKRVIEKAGLTDLHIHDLRHCFASVAAGLNLGLPVIGKLLGHTQAQTTQRYAHLMNDPLRAATEAIGEEISRAARGEVAEVVEMTPERVTEGKQESAIR